MGQVGPLTVRVLVLSNLYPPDVLGGYEMLAADVTTVLRARGHVAEVLTSGDGTTAAGVVRTLRITRPFGSDPRSDRFRHMIAAQHNGRATRRYVSTHGRPDVALVMSLRRLGLAPVRVLQQLGVPCVFTVNDDWPMAYGLARRTGATGLARTLIDRHVFAFKTWRGVRVQHVIYLSQAVRQTILEAGLPFPTGVVHPQGIDLRLFAPRPYRPISPRPTLLSVGRIHPSKAPEVAMDALAVLRASGVQAQLQYAGASGDRGYLAELQKRSQRLGVAEYVQWLGMVDRRQLPDLYRSGDVLLFASSLAHEGQGLTYLEAMACGVPVVAYPSGGAREFLEQHPSCRLARQLSGEAFAEEIGWLMAHPQEQRDLVARALQMVRADASLDAYVTALEQAMMVACR